MLTLIKVLHTVIWAILASSILALPALAIVRRFRWAAVLSGLVLVDCGVIALNGGRCPLTDLAERLTSNRADNFDIYLPIWLAGTTKSFLARSLFVAGESVALKFWFKETHAASARQVSAASY
jgi:hypothetical protein